MTAYSAWKAGLSGFAEAFQAEYVDNGVKATALCPAFVEPATSDAVRGYVDPSELIQVDDVVSIVRVLPPVSFRCTVPVSLQSLAWPVQAWEEGLARRRNRDHEQGVM